MARSVILGNGGLTVGLNEAGMVHDFYYPYVGLENLTTARSKFHHVGVWVDGEFSWVHDDEWQREVTFSPDALVSDILATNEKLGIGLHFEDFVDSSYDIFARRIRVRNMSDEKKEVRIFFHQVFQISSEGRADTVMYVPDGHYVLDYKGRCSILVYAESGDGKPFDQYSVGNANIEGKEGTFKDAEDGELSMSAVEHASVDSTIGITVEVDGGDVESVHYWLATADSQTRLEQLHAKMLDGGFSRRIHATRQHWHDWLAISEPFTENMSDDYKIAIRKSLMTLKAHIDEHGGIIASCDSSIYNYGRDYYTYVWPRDGAFVVWPLIKLGYTHEAKKFFEFSRSVMHQDGYMMHKYQPDRAIGSTWHPLVHGKRKELAIQEDETAIIVFMLAEYARYSGDEDFVDSMFDSFVRPAADFMCDFIDAATGLPHASYDLWEEKFLTNTYTTAITYKALTEAAAMARDRGLLEDAAVWQSTADELQNNSATFYNEDRKLLNKGFHWTEDETRTDDVLDISSFYGAYMFGYGDESTVRSTLKAIESNLLDQSPSGGSPRYEHDNYFQSDPPHMGNPWFVTTLWVAQFYALDGDPDKAKKYIEWSFKNMLPSGVLSEQIAPEDSEIRGVTPLIWSHAELINTILLT